METVKFILEILIELCDIILVIAGLIIFLLVVYEYFGDAIQIVINALN